MLLSVSNLLAYISYGDRVKIDGLKVWIGRWLDGQTDTHIAKCRLCVWDFVSGI